MEELIKYNSKIKVHDPKALNNARKIFGNKIEYCEDNLEAVRDADALILVTEVYNALSKQIQRKMLLNLLKLI